LNISQNPFAAVMKNPATEEIENPLVNAPLNPAKI
jgi:hypothetical protein